MGADLELGVLGQNGILVISTRDQIRELIPHFCLKHREG